ncbi:polysaccharide biosynthesis tyrosine autokinase [Nordella sp. HKS 07]|uniref:GumC family protein n=1 Tax=Nordella sp. HKS 07 TaxID=2712222 RepID=UPI0013E187E8|nr:exopolysaccharide transport family protein [Nordella sp. HKS 07]QIG50926.1 polysaccharide biosynthesis tyrosine autokinase [Nordella sp. HKS 07]
MNASSVDMMDLLRGLWRRKWMILLITVLFAAAAAFFVLRDKPSYAVEAQLLVDNLETPFSRAQPGEGSETRPAFDDRDILSQVSVLKSRDLGDRVIKELSLAGKGEFDPARNGVGKIGQILIALGFKDDPLKKSLEDRAYDRYDSQLNVYQIPESKIIIVKYSALDPQVAADVANKLAETYVVSTREAQSEPTGRARAWLAEQIDILRKKVADSEAAAEEFRAQAGLLKGTQATLGTQELSELNSQITQAQAARTEAQTKAKAIRELLDSSGSVEVSADVLNSPFIQRLREQQITLQRSMAELSVTYLPSHPKMVALRNEIANVDQQIRTEVLKIVAGLEDQARVAATREASLRANLNAAKAKASTSNLDDVKLRALERDAAANRSLLESFLNRYADASARQEVAAQPGFARVIQRAVPPANPSYPLKGPTIILATLAGLTLAIGLAFLAEVLKLAGGTVASAPAMREPSLEAPGILPAPTVEVAATLPAPPRQQMPPPPVPPHLSTGGMAPPGNQAILSEIPETPDLTRAVAHASQPLQDPSGAYAVAAGRIVSWLNNARQSLGVQKLAVTAIGEDGPDGATAAVALARIVAAQGVGALVIDVDERRPSIHTICGIEAGVGLSDILLNEATIENAVQRDSGSLAHILRAGTRAGELADAVTGARFDALIDAFAQIYPVIIVHCGAQSASAQTVIRKCHSALLMAPGTRILDAARTIESWRQSGLRAVQFVRIGQSVRRVA